MNDVEEKISDLQRHTAIQDAKFEMFMRGLEDFKAEMRDRDNQRAAENARRAEEIQALRTETDAKVGRIESKLDEVGSHVRNMGIMTLLGIAAMVIAVILK